MKLIKYKLTIHMCKNGTLAFFYGSSVAYLYNNLKTRWTVDGVLA